MKSAKISFFLLLSSITIETTVVILFLVENWRSWWLLVPIGISITLSVVGISRLYKAAVEYGPPQGWKPRWGMAGYQTVSKFEALSEAILFGITTFGVLSCAISIGALGDALVGIYKFHRLKNLINPKRI